jgi:hypothetical protein
MMMMMMMMRRRDSLGTDKEAARDSPCDYYYCYE